MPSSLRSIQPEKTTELCVNMEENNESKNCCPKMPEEEPDDWSVAVLTAGFAMGVAATFAAIKLIGKLMEQ